MKFGASLIFLKLLLIVSSKKLNLSSHCNEESDHTKLGRCLRPWLDLWELIRVHEVQASDLLFPMPLYSRESILFLCNAYLNSRDNCLLDEIIEKCRDNEMLTFVQSHTEYFCGSKAELAFSKFDCIKSALLDNKECLRFIRGIPSPTHQQGKCKYMPKFFDCAEQAIRFKCSNDAVLIFADEIISFGCSLDEEISTSSAKFISKKNVTGELTKTIGERFIQKELPAVLPLLDEQNDVEENIFLESDPSIEIAFNEDEKVNSSMQINKNCDEEKENQLANCYLSTVNAWENIRKEYKEEDYMRFPPFNYSFIELKELCTTLENALEKCLPSELLRDCEGNRMIEFMDDNFGVLCTQLNSDGFSEEFDCLKSVLSYNQKCLNFVKVGYAEDQNGEKKCHRISAFYDCLESDLRWKCGTQSLALFIEIITNYGCNLEQTKRNKFPIFSRGDINLQTVQALKSTDSQEILQKSADTTDHGDEWFSYKLAAECTQEMRSKAQHCVSQLINTWKIIRDKQPILKSVSFPMYQYEREDLLELCDGYANIFLCAGFEPIMHCLNDELVRFARDHFGYICSPQNIERFMHHYDCIMELNIIDPDNCDRFIVGSTEPGKDQRKCNGVKQYFDCLTPGILQRCNQSALKELKESISEFGCRV